MQSELRVRVNSLWMRTLEKATLEVVRESVIIVCNHYNLDVGEALALVGGVRSEEVSMKKRGGAKELKSVTKEVKTKEVKTKASKSAFPLPFGVKAIVEDGCCGLAYNNGLFTQCEKVRQGEFNYCKTCQKEADGSSNGKPLNGTVADRVSCALMEFRDTKGRAPLAYSRIMAKRGLTRATVEEEVARLNLEISEVHFEESSTRGRPKVEKKKKVSAETVEDLLAKMIETREDDMTEFGSQADTEVMSDSEDEGEGFNVEDELAHEKQERSDMKTAELEQKRVEKANKQAEEKAQRAIERAIALASAKEEREAKVAQEKSEREAKVAQAKAEKEAKLAELAIQKAEKEANLALAKAEKEEKLALAKAEKAEKEAKLAQEKEAKLALAKAEKEAKLAQEKAEKEAKLAQEKAEKEAKLASAKKPVAKKPEPVAKKPEPVAKKPEPVAKKPEASASASASAPVAKKVTVTRITIEGVQYLKTGENLLYNPTTKEEVGIYDPETQTIKPLPEESDDELDEDEYDSDGN